MSHYAKMKKAACGTSADGREDPRKGEKDIKDSIAQALDKDKRNFKNGGNARWHAAKEPQIIEQHRQGKSCKEIAAATGVGMSAVYTVLQKRGLKANKGGEKCTPPPAPHPAPRCFHCVHPDCKYAARETQEYRCDYIGQTGHSRLLWHRVRGLSEEIEDCRLYEPGKRRVLTQGVNLKTYSGDGKVATTGRLKYPRKAKKKEPKITTKLIRKRELAEARDAERLELYDRGMTDTQIAAALGVAQNTVTAWRTSRGLPSQTEKKKAKEEFVFRRLYEAGYSLAECEKLIGRARATLAAWRDAAGIAPQGREKITEERRARREQARSELEATGLIAAKEE